MGDSTPEIAIVLIQLTIPRWNTEIRHEGKSVTKGRFLLKISIQALDPCGAIGKF
jgi:hypothetical protein